MVAALLAVRATAVLAVDSRLLTEEKVATDLLVLMDHNILTVASAAGVWVTMVQVQAAAIAAAVAAKEHRVIAQHGAEVAAADPLILVQIKVIHLVLEPVLVK
jgi:hypothetical protein